MAATKGTKKAAKKGGTKKAAKKIVIPGRGPHPLYGRPIDNAIARGDLATMRKLSTQAKSYLKQLQTAMARLDKSIAGKAG